MDTIVINRQKPVKQPITSIVAKSTTGGPDVAKVSHSGDYPESIRLTTYSTMSRWTPEEMRAFAEGILEFVEQIEGE